jgi:FAD/FMN-containing dehydrogenase
MNQARLRDTGRFQHQQSQSPSTIGPDTSKALLGILDPQNGYARPIRPAGGRSSATDCYTSSMGTSIDMTGLDRIIDIDHDAMTATAMAGVPLVTLSRALAAEGLELIGSFELSSRTLGGAIAAPCFGPSIGRGVAYLSSSVQSVRLALANGRLVSIRPEQQNLLAAVRLSYGLLGAIVEATLKVRPATVFHADHRRVSIDDFARAAGSLADADVGLQFYVMPHKDRAYLDIRRFSAEPQAGGKTPWVIKDWGESTVLPRVFNSLNKVVPIKGVRFGLIDSIGAATHDMVNTRFVSRGSNATSESGRYRAIGTDRVRYTTWCFPATDFGVVLQAYRDFCLQAFQQHGYRADLPAMGYRLAQDKHALLSPTLDEPMIALQTMSTIEKGWEDFVIDVAEFAEHWGGVPLFNLTRSASVDHARHVYGRRRDMFNRIRRQLDPDNRLLNPFLAQYFL